MFGNPMMLRGIRRGGVIPDIAPWLQMEPGDGPRNGPMLGVDSWRKTPWHFERDGYDML